MALNKVEICGVNTAKLPMLTQEEKDALFIKIKAGDQAARETFIKGNLRLVLSVIKRFGASNENADDLYISWLSSLPRYYTEGNTIFVHAGIDETVGDMWEWETSDDIYTSKYPAETGRIEGLDMKVVAGHVYTSEISGDSTFNDIYYDGENHIYIDGDVLSTGVIPVLMVDTDTDRYYRITDGGC